MGTATRPATERDRWRGVLRRERERYLLLLGGEAGPVPAQGAAANREQHATARPVGTERLASPELRERAGALVGLIDEALRRLEAGTFGICERCGRPIEAERLELVPYTTMCAACRLRADADAARARPTRLPMRPTRRAAPPAGRAGSRSGGEPGRRSRLREV